MSGSARPAKAQMPDWLEKIGDSRGILWRTYNVISGIDLARTAHFVRAWADGPTFENPVFIIGAPRSGTSLLFEILSLHPNLASMGHEGHDIWRRFHHPRKYGWSSDAIDASRANAKRERRFAEAFIRARTIDKPNANRFVEKTPENTLRVEYILKLFPQARFIAIHRDPCAVVNSLIDGWRDPDGRFRSYFVPVRLDIPNYRYVHRWCFSLIPGWRELVKAPIPLIALRQWETYITALNEARSTLAPEQLSEVYLEDLRASPQVVLKGLEENLKLSIPSACLLEMSERAETRVNSLSGGQEENWRNRNQAEIEQLLPQIAELASLIGYDVDSTTGLTTRL